MKRKTALLLTSCILGLITSSIYASRIQNLRDEIANFSEKVPVLTVSRNISAGELLLSEDLRRTMVLKNQVSARAVLPEDMELVAGRQVIHPIPAADTVLWTDFPEGPRLQYPTEKIPPGYRVIALPADEVHTLTHFLSPGDKVDIVSSAFHKSENRLVSQSVAEGIVIFGVGRQLEGQAAELATDDYPLSVSILVHPEKALAILTASQTGEIHFLARGSNPFSRGYDGRNGTIPATGFPKEPQ